MKKKGEEEEEEKEEEKEEEEVDKTCHSKTFAYLPQYPHNYDSPEGTYDITNIFAHFNTKTMDINRRHYGRQMRCVVSPRGHHSFKNPSGEILSVVLSQREVMEM